MKWFSIKGIVAEVKKIKWPKLKELGRNTGEVLVFTIAFGVFFVVCEFVVSALLNFII